MIMIMIIIIIIIIINGILSTAQCVFWQNDQFHKWPCMSTQSHTTF